MHNVGFTQQLYSKCQPVCLKVNDNAIQLQILIRRPMGIKTGTNLIINDGKCSLMQIIAPAILEILHILAHLSLAHSLHYAHKNMQPLHPIIATKLYHPSTTAKD